MSLLVPAPELHPVVTSIEDYSEPRLVFTFGEWWRYFPGYASYDEYHHALSALVQGALLALSPGDEKEIVISTDPFRVPWIEWLLPMQRLQATESKPGTQEELLVKVSTWRPSEPLDPQWPLQVAQYAQLFKDGILEADYVGACTSSCLPDALHLCADVVLQNLAPCSWIFSNPSTRVAAYFHSTSSIGVYMSNRRDQDELIERANKLGLHLQLNSSHLA